MMESGADVLHLMLAADWMVHIAYCSSIDKLFIVVSGQFALARRRRAIRILFRELHLQQYRSVLSGFGNLTWNGAAVDREMVVEGVLVMCGTCSINRHRGCWYAGARVSDDGSRTERATARSTLYPISTPP